MCCNEKFLENLKAVNSMYDFLNAEFFHGMLPKPVITIQHDRKGRALGWFTCWESWQANGSSAPEINISANFLDREPIDTAATMLHEMCHLYAYLRKIQDCSRSGTWHNKRFKEIAEAHGLIVEKTNSGGWNHTKLTAEARATIEKALSEMPKLKRVQTEKPGKKSSTRKYVCPDCETSVRATKEVNIICGDCDKKMQEVTE
jgi:predicted SprT family Zn-dependent metalloprotease